jgi:hypothetical protein
MNALTPHNVRTSDGRIPSGFLAASMTSVRLSFRASLGRCPFGAFYHTQARTKSRFQGILGSCTKLSHFAQIERGPLELGSYRPECQRHGGSKTRVWGLLEARRILNPIPAWQLCQSSSTSGALAMSQRWVEGTITGSALPGRSLHFRTHPRASVWSVAASCFLSL